MSETQLERVDGKNNSTLIAESENTEYRTVLRTAGRWRQASDTKRRCTVCSCTLTHRYFAGNFSTKAVPARAWAYRPVGGLDRIKNNAQEASLDPQNH